eukprot:TRINITY_DN3290_c0_g1_i2.p1 TRINITY_DN3290_c0_g1~~TRINITY_DN3290_c0_g1_i2.p1  ORF type:complete len:186 (-),score=41.21 TRINITY_DN3290_c0_g1_i2:106-663(-)
MMQCLVGLFIDACLLGLIYARFARTKLNTSILFSNQAVWRRDGQHPVLQFRVANLRRHQIIDGRLRMYLAYLEEEYGEMTLRLDDLAVDRSGMAFFASFPFLVSHIIDEKSPLHLKSDVLNRGGEILVLFDAVDTATSTDLQSRTSYIKEEIEYDSRFENILRENIDGRLQVDFPRFHQTLPIRR